MKSLLRSSARAAKTLWLQGCYRNSVFARLERPTVSLTFDDVPLSTMTNGVPILDAYGIKSTFYVALGIEDEEGAACPTQFLGPPEVAQVAALGHEIGCHTFSHYRLSQGSATGQLADARKNVEALENILGKGTIKNFSFPYGELSLRAKKLFASEYKSLRSSRPGINNGRVDLNCLKAVSMGREFLRSGEAEHWLAALKENGGWLILYTHGILDDPTRYDMTSHDLNELLLKLERMDVDIKPLGMVIDQMVEAATVAQRD